LNGATTRQAAGTAPERLVLVQVLRGMAALLVLLGHVQEQLAVAMAKAGMPPWPRLAWPGGFGVDLFFCISGFIMVVTSARLFGQPGATRNFLRRRALRLVPLYWLATGAFGMVLALGTQPGPAQPVQAWLASLLFIPYPTRGIEGDMVFPLLSLGWSLNYEVLFYLLFSVAIVLPARRAVLAVWAALLLLTAAGAVLEPDHPALVFWSRPIVLEFGMGMLVGLGWLTGRRLPASWCTALALAALAWLLADPLNMTQAGRGAPTPNDLMRLLGWGMPAALALAAAVALQRPAGHTARASALLQPVAWLARLGDWSYALYLFHPFMLIAMAHVWLRLQAATGMPPGWMLPAMLAGSVGLAALVHHRVDLPLARRLAQGWPLIRLRTAA